jgi:uncharacterized protein YcbK (DUF882 family)
MNKLKIMQEVSMNKDMKLSEHLASPSEAALSHSSKLDGLRLSPHFTLGELTKTSYKTEDGNIPSRVAIENLKNLCENWLEDLRYSYNTLYPRGCPQDTVAEPAEALGPSEGIIINSGYRSPEVNKRAGGSATSNHLTGCAVDIRVGGFEQAIRYASILLDISDGTKQDFDELYIERNGAGRYWIHFAVRPKDNRRKTRFIQT